MGINDVTFGVGKGRDCQKVTKSDGGRGGGSPKRDQKWWEDWVNKRLANSGIKVTSKEGVRGLSHKVRKSDGGREKQIAYLP